MTPTQVTRGCFSDVWWKCKYGHEWIARISARDYGNGCPYCGGNSRTSKPEQLLFMYIKKYFPDALNMYSLNGVSLDIYIPSLKIAIEYDSSYWHIGKNTDYKFDFCRDNGISLYKISGLKSSDKRVYYLNDKYLSINVFPNNLTDVMLVFFKDVLNIDIDFSDYNIVKSKAVTIFTKKSNLEITDNMRLHWSSLNGYSIDYIQNDDTDKYWVCEYSHTFKRRLDVIRRHGFTCPYCTNKRAFRFFLLTKISDMFVVLDTVNGDIEFINSELVLSSASKGINIRGIFIKDSKIIVDISYIYSYKPTSFRSDFFKFKSIGFKACTNSIVCVNFVNDLNNLFFSEISIDKTLSHFINFLEAKKKKGVLMPHDSFDKTSHTIGDVGEVITSSTLRDLGFTLVRSVYLPYKGKEVQIDIVLISGNDLFVIENKNYNAKIYGSKNAKYWKDYYTDECFEFSNPVLQNEKHCYSIQQVFSNYVVHNIVIFNDKATLKTTSSHAYLLSEFIEKYGDMDKSFDKIVYTKLLSYSDSSEERCKKHVDKML